MMNDLSLDAWAAFTCVMFVKCFLNSAIQAAIRFRSKSFAFPEDQKFFASGGEAGQVSALQERAAAAWRNDLENIPIAIFLLLAATLLGATPVVVISLCCVFGTSRFVHFAALMLAKQPWRNLAYQAGNLALFATVAQIVVRIIARH